jgi:hypothetical protein
MNEKERKVKIEEKIQKKKKFFFFVSCINNRVS